MRFPIAALFVSLLPMTVTAETQTESFICQPWSNAELQMRGDVKLELSGLKLMWTNGKLTQTVVMVNPDDKLEGNVSKAKRIYVAEDSAALYFLKKFLSCITVNRTIVSVRGSKPNTTYCQPEE